MKSFANSLLPSSFAPSMPGPTKILLLSKPLSSRKSLKPSTRGFSGPTTIRSISLSITKFAIDSKSETPKFTFSAISDVPGLPGAQYKFFRSGLFDKERAIACSLPPEPITRTLFIIDVGIQLKDY